MLVRAAKSTEALEWGYSTWCFHPSPFQVRDTTLDPALAPQPLVNFQSKTK